MANEYLSEDWKMVDLAKDSKDKTQKNIDHLSVLCPFHNRIRTLTDVILTHGGIGKKIIVFTKTKRDCDEIVVQVKTNHFSIEAMHGDIAQDQR